MYVTGWGRSKQKNCSNSTGKARAQVSQLILSSDGRTVVQDLVYIMQILDLDIKCPFDRPTQCALERKRVRRKKTEDCCPV